MPMYDFKCPSGHTSEGLGKPGVPRECPECGAEAVPQVGAPAFALKGPGWCDKGRPVAGRGAA